MYKERDEKKRAGYQAIIKNIAPEKIVYLDESGMLDQCERSHGYAIKGKKLLGERSGKRTGRINLIAGLCQKKVLAAASFRSSCNSEMFNYWLEHSLLPELSKGYTIVMDNATFHKNKKTRQLIESHGCHLLYLPAAILPRLQPHRNLLGKPQIQNQTPQKFPLLTPSHYPLHLLQLSINC